MVVGSASKRRRTASESTAQNSTPSRAKPPTGRGRGRPPNVPRDGRERPPSLLERFKSRCDEVLDRLIKKDHYNIFLEPVNTDDVVGYLDIIKCPMDFTTMRNKLARQQYRSLGEFRKDLDLIWSNCLLFNGKEPTNVFSKKAIELRRLTERLIVNTRQQLEKDKEFLNQWKEKHRRKKDNAPANAMQNQSGMSDAVMSGATAQTSAKGLVRNSQSVPESREMDGVTTEFENDEENGRTSQQVAIAEAMRLQYAGSSGLHKRSHLNNPLPHYTRPDGSIVEIPIARYDPSEDHWGEEVCPLSESRHNSHLPQLMCDALPPSRNQNPCYPRPGLDALVKDDYATSLLQFAKKVGPVAFAVALEVLGPELMVKVYQDQWKMQGLSLADLAKRAEAARNQPLLPDHVPKYNWTADEIMQLADDIERSNKKGLPILPKPPRSVPDLDGIEGLKRYLDPKLIKEVEDVPMQVIDFAMPHGVQTDSLLDILQLKAFNTLQLSPRDQESLDKLKKSADDFIAAHSPDNRAQIFKASAPTNQLHQVQIKAYAMKRQRRLDAERQAAIMSQCLAGAGATPQPAQQSTKRKRDVETPISTSLSQRSSERRGSQYQATRVAVARRSAAENSTATQARMGFGSSVPHSADAPAQSVALRVDPNRKAVFQPPQNGISATPSCTRCGTKDSPSWHALPNGLGCICLPCGIEWQNAQRNRQKEVVAALALQTAGKRPRGSVEPFQNGRAATAQMHGIAKGTQDNGIHTPSADGTLSGGPRFPAGSPLNVGTPHVASPSPPSPSRASTQSVPNGVTTRSMHRNPRNSPPVHGNSAATRKSPDASMAAHKKQVEMQKLPAAIGKGELNASMNLPTMQNFQHIHNMQSVHNAQNVPTINDAHGVRAQGMAQGILPNPNSNSTHGPGPLIDRSQQNTAPMHPNVLQSANTRHVPNGPQRAVPENAHGFGTEPRPGNLPAIGGRPMAFPRGTDPQASFVHSTQGGSIPDLRAFRQSLSNGGIPGQGLLASQINSVMGSMGSAALPSPLTQLGVNPQANLRIYNGTPLTQVGHNPHAKVMPKPSMAPNIASIHQNSLAFQHNSLQPHNHMTNPGVIPHGNATSQPGPYPSVSPSLKVNSAQQVNPAPLGAMDKRIAPHLVSTSSDVGGGMVRPSLSKPADMGTLPFAMENQQKGPNLNHIQDASGGMANAPQRYVTQSFENGEIMSGFHGNETMFGNGTCSNGMVNGAANIGGELFFDEGDLAVTSAAAPELDF